MHLFNIVKKILSRVDSLLLILPANVYTRQLRMQSLGNADTIVGEPSAAQAKKKRLQHVVVYIDRLNTLYVYAHSVILALDSN